MSADDRDRMMRMRAVPEDFDTVSALHSRYGAVQVTPDTPAPRISTIKDHLIGPLTIDTIKSNSRDDVPSPLSTALSSSFSAVSFGTTSTMDNQQCLSPVPPSATTDCFFPSQPSSPMSSAHTGDTYDPVDMSQGFAYSRHSNLPRPLSIQVARSRSESVHSPLRSSMSWKGEMIEHNAHHLEPRLSAKQRSTYRPQPLSRYVAQTLPNSSNSSPSQALPVRPEPHFASAQRSASCQQAPLQALVPQVETRTPYTLNDSHQNISHAAHNLSYGETYYSGLDVSPLKTPDSEGPSRMYSQPSTPQRQQSFAGPFDYTAGASQAYEQDKILSRERQLVQSLRSSDGNKNFFLGPVDPNPGHRRKRSYTLPGSFSFA